MWYNNLIKNRKDFKNEKRGGCRIFSGMILRGSLKLTFLNFKYEKYIQIL